MKQKSEAYSFTFGQFHLVTWEVGPWDPTVKYGISMKTLIVVLLVVWAAIAVIGFVVKALLWLALIGVVLFVGTIAFWKIRSKMSQGADAATAD